MSTTLFPASGSLSALRPLAKTTTAVTLVRDRPETPVLDSRELMIVWIGQCPIVRGVFSTVSSHARVCIVPTLFSIAYLIIYWALSAYYNWIFLLIDNPIVPGPVVAFVRHWVVCGASDGYTTSSELR